MTANYTMDKMKKRARTILNTTMLEDITNTKNFENSELRKTAEAVTIQQIVEAMFDRSKFMFRVEDAAMFSLLTDEVKQFIREFLEAEYRRIEGRFLMRTTGIRYDKCNEFKKSQRFALARKLMGEIVRLKPENRDLPSRPILYDDDETDPLIDKFNNIPKPEREREDDSNVAVLPSQDKTERDF